MRKDTTNKQASLNEANWNHNVFQNDDSTFAIIKIEAYAIIHIERVLQ